MSFNHEKNQAVPDPQVKRQPRGFFEVKKLSLEKLSGFCTEFGAIIPVLIPENTNSRCDIGGVAGRGEFYSINNFI